MASAIELRSMSWSSTARSASFRSMIALPYVSERNVLVCKSLRAAPRSEIPMSLSHNIQRLPLYILQNYIFSHHTITHHNGIIICIPHPALVPKYVSLTKKIAKTLLDAFENPSIESANIFFTWLGIRNSLEKMRKGGYILSAYQYSQEMNLPSRQNDVLKGVQTSAFISVKSSEQSNTLMYSIPPKKSKLGTTYPDGIVT